MYLLGALALLAAGAATTATAGDNENPPEQVTICHVAGLASDPANYITLTLPWVAVYGEAGHFFENGTPRAGHEQDTLGECNPPPPTDVCPNLEGNQSELPDGYHFAEDENGRTICVQNPPPEDVCPNLEGNQQEVPDGYQLVDGQCVQTPPPPRDLCPNITGVQEQVPAGMVVNQDGNCVTPGTPSQVTGTATARCDLGNQTYRLTGTIDGQQADVVTPETFPGTTKGTVNVTVKRGDTSFRTTVTLNGDCAPPTTITPPSVTTIVPITVTAVVKPVAKPKPTVKPKPKPTRKPVAHKAKPKPKKPTVHTCKMLKDGTPRVWVKGHGCVPVPGEPKDLTG